MSLETLLVVVAVAGMAVFNVIVPWLKKLQERGLAGEAEGDLQAAPTAAPVPRLDLGLSAPPMPDLSAQRIAASASTAPMAPATTRPARRLRIGSRSGLRDGIVLAAVLGPCRAQTPFG